MTKQEATAKILYALRNQLIMTCKPDREDALRWADEFGITAKDLLESAYKRAKDA
jgi:hypothetical protein